MRSVRLRTLALGLCWPLSQLASASEPLRPPPALVAISQSDRLLRDGADGKLDDFSLVRGALVASGVEEESQFRDYEQKLANWSAQFQKQVASTSSQRDRASLLLVFLHREILTGPYDPACGNLAQTLNGGQYNCVTASILYWHLAEQAHLAPGAWHRTGHVRLQLAELPDCFVETTCPNWLGLVASNSAAPPERAIAAPALIGKLYYNQGLQALARDDHAAAIRAFQQARGLDGLDADAQQNLLATYNNGALALCDRSEFTAALEWLDAARRLDPHYAPLAKNTLHVEQRWVVWLCQQRRFTEALARLSQGAAKYPDAELFRTGHIAVYRLWAEDLLARGEKHAALAKVEFALALAPHDEALLALRRRLA